MSDEIRRALDAESRASFQDLKRRLEADRPGACDALEADVTALATGASEPEAERHVAECARCRDRVDASRDAWRLLAWPESKSRFADLEPRLLAPLPFRPWRAAAAVFLAAAVAGAVAWPMKVPTGGRDLGYRLERDGLSLGAIAALGTERAARTLVAIGSPEADALLVGMMGRNREIDAFIAPALARADVGPLHPADLVRDWRPDLLPALIDAAPPGSAWAIVPALFDPALAVRATLALERLPRDETESALEFAGLGATPEEAAALARREVAVAGALAAALRSRDHMTRCFWSAVAAENGVDFLIAAAASPLLREEALMFLGLLPEDTVSAACRKALGDPALAAGAARAAAWLGDPRLVPALMRAAKSPPPGMGSAGFRIEEGELVSARSESFETICLDAVAQITRP